MSGLVAGHAMWVTCGAQGWVHHEGPPQKIKIPEFDGGPLVSVTPTKMETSFTFDHATRRWRCTSLTLTGLPDRRSGARVISVSYTWTDPEEGMEALPGWLGRAWVEQVAESLPQG